MVCVVFLCQIYFLSHAVLGVVATPGSNLSIVFEVSEGDFTIRSVPIAVTVRSCTTGFFTIKII